MGSWGFVFDHALLYQNGSDSLRNEQDSEIMLSFRVGNTFSTTSILTLAAKAAYIQTCYRQFVKTIRVYPRSSVVLCPAGRRKQVP